MTESAGEKRPERQGLQQAGHGRSPNCPDEAKRLEYDVYLQERQDLNKYRQSNWESYEKTILTLSAGFLAFSVSFLGLVKKEPPLGAQPVAIVCMPLLVSSWICFAVSVLLVLLAFPVNAVAFHTETKRLEGALSDSSAVNRCNCWSIFTYVLYTLAGLSFLGGIVVLLVFCGSNTHLF